MAVDRGTVIDGHIKSLSDFMKDNEIVKLKVSDEVIEIELTREGIARHILEKKALLNDLPEKKKKEPAKDELKDFIFGKENINSKEMGELYGV